MTQKPYLNLGCGNIILPAERPAHHGLIDPAIYDYPLWHNVDVNNAPGVDQRIDLFTYPWALEDNSYDGALLAHLCEHIPHEIIVGDSSVSDIARLNATQNGWFAFFSELYRVLTDGAVVYILSPHARSDGAIHDPTHTRYLLPETFLHSMQPDPDAPFTYATGGIHFTTIDAPTYQLHPDYNHLQGRPELLQQAAMHEWNVVYGFAMKLRVVKEA